MGYGNVLSRRRLSLRELPRRAAGGGLPEVPSLDPDDATGFSAACDCPDGERPCYGEGYSRGQDKAHFEISAVVEGPPHGSGCGCEPGQTIGAVTAALVLEAALAGLSGCGLTGGTTCGSNDDDDDDDNGQRCPGWPEGQHQGNPADTCPLAPTGDALADLLYHVLGGVPSTGAQAILESDFRARQLRRGWAAHTLAVLHGTADTLGLDAVVLGMAWPGRYDGGRCCG